MTFLCDLGPHIAAHAEAYGTAAGIIAIAAIKCMPRPGAPFSWLTAYTWLYDTAQAALPVPRQSISTNSAPPLIPTPPPVVTSKYAPDLPVDDQGRLKQNP